MLFDQQDYYAELLPTEENNFQMIIYALNPCGFVSAKCDQLLVAECKIVNLQGAITAAGDDIDTDGLKIIAIEDYYSSVKEEELNSICDLLPKLAGKYLGFVADGVFKGSPSNSRWFKKDKPYDY